MGNYSRKSFGYWAFADYIRIAWRISLRPHKTFRFDPKLVLGTVKLLASKGKATYGLVKALEDMIHALEDLREEMQETPSEEQLIILKELLNFLEDVEEHGPHEWGTVVISNARRIKDVERMRRGLTGLHFF